MQSCIYEGTVKHCRREPVTHRFQYRLFMVYLDLDELPMLLDQRGLFQSNTYASRSFLRDDHLFDPSRPLADEVRDVVRQKTGQLTKGPIRLLTQLRHFGYYMSPLNLYYVFDQTGSNVEYVVAEVNNTPWNERHCYVLWDGNRQTEIEGEGEGRLFAHAKDFHVSPFMDMDMQYQWRLDEPGSGLQVQLANTSESRLVFDANMQLERRELGRHQLRRLTLRYPLMTAQISAGIYYQALKLWWKKCPRYTHPNKLMNATSQAPQSTQNQSTQNQLTQNQLTQNQSRPTVTSSQKSPRSNATR